MKEGNADEANKTIKKINKTTLSKIAPETLSKYYTVLGSIHQVNTNFIQAIEYYNKSIEALKKKDEHDKADMEEVYGQLLQFKCALSQFKGIV
ncbi:MAG: hypothetical protein IPK03_09740 [Bacteroidetes bacterium]|nr:hypothetical protein [Bacteroidota bacterium]